MPKDQTTVSVTIYYCHATLKFGKLEVVLENSQIPSLLRSLICVLSIAFHVRMGCSVVEQYLSPHFG